MSSASRPISIAICGLGAAGNARQQAVREVSGVSLAGLVSRRPGIGDRRLDQVLADPAVDAVAISTENTSHAGLVRSCLEAGKHVLCDYPLALSGAEARELFRLAAERRRVLHVEHIALLAEEHQALKAEAAKVGPLLRGDYLFQGNWNEKLADVQRSGPIPFLALSRLLQVADLFGPFRIAASTLESRQEGFRLHLHLAFEGGGVLGFTEERRSGLPRRRSLIAECAQGSLTLKVGGMGGSLFARDLEWFRDRVLFGKGCYYDEEIMLEILDQLTAL